MLTREHYATDTWKLVRKGLEQRLGDLRELNDSSKNDELKTAAIRGQIAEVKRMLTLGQTPNVSTDADPG